MRFNYLKDDKMIKVSTSLNAVKVYKDGLLVGEVFTKAPIHFCNINEFKSSKFNISLITQLTNKGLTSDEIAEVYK